MNSVRDQGAGSSKSPGRFSFETYSAEACHRFPVGLIGGAVGSLGTRNTRQQALDDWRGGAMFLIAPPLEGVKQRGQLT
ncbi:hypothetical protein GCM10020220_030070 [Nonomuraea rubra]